MNKWNGFSRIVRPFHLNGCHVFNVVREGNWIKFFKHNHNVTVGLSKIGATFRKIYQAAKQCLWGLNVCHGLFHLSFSWKNIKELAVSIQWMRLLNAATRFHRQVSQMRGFEGRICPGSLSRLRHRVFRRIFLSTAVLLSLLWPETVAAFRT